MKDPRSHRRYVQTRAAWLPAQAGRRCCLCGEPVDITLPATSRLGPTVEHTLPIRDILRLANSWAEAVAMACDTSLWDLAHRRCQSQQGARVSNVTRHGRPERKPSRRWGRSF